MFINLKYCFLECFKDFAPWPKFLKYFSFKPILNISFDLFSLTGCNIVNVCHLFLKEVWIYLIDIFKLFVVWKIYFLESVFISINHVILKWTESNFLSLSSVLMTPIFLVQEMSWWSDKPTFTTPSWEFFQGCLLIRGQLMMYYYMSCRFYLC